LFCILEIVPNFICPNIVHISLAFIVELKSCRFGSAGIMPVVFPAAVVLDDGYASAGIAIENIPPRSATEAAINGSVVFIIHCDIL
jgi:hypothetical protein